MLGTLGYMSPEQVRGKPADARSDIFSFGAILYEMLSGKRAFHGDSAADTMSAILKEDPAGSLRHQPEHLAGPRAHRAPLPREEPRAALPLGARPRLRPRGALDDVVGQAAPTPAQAAAASPVRRSPRSSVGLVGRGRPRLRSSRRRRTRRRRAPRRGPADVPPPDQPLRSRGVPDASRRTGSSSRSCIASGRKTDIWVQRAGSRKPDRPHGRLRARELLAGLLAGREPDRLRLAVRRRRIFVMGATGENVRRLTQLRNASRVVARTGKRSSSRPS